MVPDGLNDTRNQRLMGFLCPQDLEGSWVGSKCLVPGLDSEEDR